jgi:hypothetical protein
LEFFIALQRGMIYNECIPTIGAKFKKAPCVGFGDGDEGQWRTK